MWRAFWRAVVDGHGRLDSHSKLEGFRLAAGGSSVAEFCKGVG